MQSMDASPTTNTDDTNLESSEDETDQTDGGELEWERVPVTLPEADLLPSYITSTQVSKAGGRSDTSTSMAGNLFSSTAASITSLFWGRKDNK